MKDKYKFIGIFLCMFLCTSCGSNNYEEKEKLFFRILSVYSFGEQKNVHISDLNRECLIINSENDLKNSNLPETLVDSISQENINFDTMSLLIKPSYIDYPPN